MKTMTTSTAPQYMSDTVHSVSMRLSLACDLTSRLRGLTACSQKGGVLLLAPCHDIHTFGMRKNIDVAFANSEGKVIASYRSVPPRKRLKCAGAVAVMERFTVWSSPWFNVGDRLNLASVPELYENTF